MNRAAIKFPEQGEVQTESGRVLSNPLALLREPTPNPELLPYTPGAAPPHSSSFP
jgi:hypothetical protein